MTSLCISMQNHSAGNGVTSDIVFFLSQPPGISVPVSPIFGTMWCQASLAAAGQMQVSQAASLRAAVSGAKSMQQSSLERSACVRFTCVR